MRRFGDTKFHKLNAYFSEVVFRKLSTSSTTVFNFAKMAEAEPAGDGAQANEQPP